MRRALVSALFVLAASVAAAPAASAAAPPSPGRPVSDVGCPAGNMHLVDAGPITNPDAPLHLDVNGDWLLCWNGHHRWADNILP